VDKTRRSGAPPSRQSDWCGCFAPTSLTRTPRLNPHRARGIDGGRACCTPSPFNTPLPVDDVTQRPTLAIGAEIVAEDIHAAMAGLVAAVREHLQHRLLDEAVENRRDAEGAFAPSLRRRSRWQPPNHATKSTFLTQRT
jgi:hypothetical protein